MKRAKWVMCCRQLVTTTKYPPAIRLLVILMVPFQLSGCGTVWRGKKFRVIRSYRPQLSHEVIAASSARIRRASEVVRILSPWTGGIGGKVAAVMWRTFSWTKFHCQ
jgi:hypothetical protein